MIGNLDGGPLPHAPSCRLFPAPLLGIRGVAGLIDPNQSAGNLHDVASREVLLQRLAGLLEVPVLAPVSPDEPRHGLLVVPPATLGKDGLSNMPDCVLLGGIVPADFISTKAITHGLVDAAAVRPKLWSHAMADLLGDAALLGFTAFDRNDAARAGGLLLARGPVRAKDVCGKAGLGQYVLRDAAELETFLGLQDSGELAIHGIVLEENLTDVVTYSVGAVTIPGHSIAYWGSQNLTIDHKGREVYGGSDLSAVRGDFSDLAERQLPPTVARAVECAMLFDRAARTAYPDVVLTRRNYDVLEGTDASGQRKIGVLEQSWRVGGASGAEVAAMEAFNDDPALETVRCSTMEVYGDAPIPTGATVYFAGVDPVVGEMTKYAVRLV